MSFVTQDQRQKSSGVLLLAMTLLIAFAIAVAVGHSRKTGNVKPALQLPVTASVVAADTETASVVVNKGVVTFYFASGKAELATGAKEALATIVAGTAAGKRAVVSGFHDSTGNTVRNAELAKNRALAVRDALLALGVPSQKIDLKKPVKTQASGANNEARRVEVSLQ